MMEIINSIDGKQECISVLNFLNEVESVDNPLSAMFVIAAQVCYMSSSLPDTGVLKRKGKMWT